jgi:hypothetical protein
VTEAKQQVIRESGALEFWPADQGESDVGGLDLMKVWLKKREVGFGAEAREANVPYPRGVALIGIPGTGKSLSAKMLSGLWKLPLLREFTPKALDNIAQGRDSAPWDGRRHSEFPQTPTGFHKGGGSQHVAIAGSDLCAYRVLDQTPPSVLERQGVP